MDQITHDVRYRQWQSIIQQCTNRAEGITARQWLTENGINEKRYYYWLRRIRKDTYEQMDLPAASTNSGVSFVEMRLPEASVPERPAPLFTTSRTADMHAAAVICTPMTSIAVSNDISAELLSAIMREITHAQ